MAGEIVPFGKYRGKPVEALAQDRQYVDWLTAQPWFREKFGNMYTLIVNNFQEPTETPEHNKLQVLFLNAAFRARFLSYTFGTPAELDSKMEFEVAGFDVHVWGSGSGDCHVEIKPTIGDDYPAVLRQMKTAERASEGTRHLVYRAVLFLVEYIGVGATCEQFIDVFENEGIRVVFLDDLTPPA